MLASDDDREANFIAVLAGVLFAKIHVATAAPGTWKNRQGRTEVRQVSRRTILKITCYYIFNGY